MLPDAHSVPVPEKHFRKLGTLSQFCPYFYYRFYLIRNTSVSPKCCWCFSLIRSGYFCLLFSQGVINYLFSASERSRKEKGKRKRERERERNEEYKSIVRRDKNKRNPQSLIKLTHLRIIALSGKQDQGQSANPRILRI